MDGNRVRVGDAVIAVGVNAGLTGYVVRLDRNRAHKPFVVDCGGSIMYFNPEWTKRIFGEKENV
jgi:hypothetical protein